MALEDVIDFRAVAHQTIKYTLKVNLLERHIINEITLIIDNIFSISAMFSKRSKREDEKEENNI